MVVEGGVAAAQVVVLEGGVVFGVVRGRVVALGGVGIEVGCFRVGVMQVVAFVRLVGEQVACVELPGVCFRVVAFQVAGVLQVVGVRGGVGQGGALQGGVIRGVVVEVVVVQ